MDANKPIEKMDDQELNIELNTLTVLRNSLQRFIPQDRATTSLLEETEGRLGEAKIERNVRWVVGLSEELNTLQSTKGPQKTHP